jgi:CAAX prenyl protease-like protein
MNEESPRPEPSLPEDEPAGIRAPVWAHVLPFVAWLFVMQMLGDPAGWKYAVRTVLCLGFFIYLRPWRWYGRIRFKNLPLAVGIGVLVFFVWIFFETDFMSQWPAVQDAYLKYGTQPPWKMPEVDLDRSYAPEVCGWHFTAIRILGSAFVIGIIEEFFWRGFVYRWALAQNWLTLDLGKFDMKIFLLVALFFGLEHHRWFVGILAGVAYGWMLIKTRDIWSVAIAHALTNLILGIYVVWAGKYVFWS